MEIKLESGTPADVRTPLLVVGAWADGTLPPNARVFDDATGGRLSTLLARGDLREKAGSTLLAYDVGNAERVLFVSLGEREGFGEKGFCEAVGAAAKAIAKTRADEALVTLAGTEVPGRDLAWCVRQASMLLADGSYRYDAPCKEPPPDRDRGVARVRLSLPTGPTPALEEAARRGCAIAEGMALARDLGNLPGNVCTPTHLAETARKLGEELPKLSVEVMERDDMERLGMGSALSVGRASATPCKFIVMNYQGAGDGAAPIVLVGKGVTFDTGGVSLKPGADMDEMKFDMCGAAAVFGAMKTVGRLGLPINVVGLVPAVENMPGGDATKPGDVVTSMKGLTIEVLNTDAEGRLILCDALTYAERFQPDCVIDVATLTGACVIALGNVLSGLYANDDALADELLACGVATHDRAWRMPLHPEYLDQLKSNFADMSNIGGKPAGSVTAACFLGRFADAFKWAHFDIAGTNARSGDEKGATGRPVPSLCAFLFGRADAAQAPGEAKPAEARAPEMEPA